MDGLLDLLSTGFSLAQQRLFEIVVQPLAIALGLSNRLEDAFDGTGWLLVGLLQIALMLTLMRSLERRWPAEAVQDMAAVRVDVIYTLIHRLGLFRLALFFSIDPLFDVLFGQMALAGLPNFQLDQIWPGVSDQPVFSFVLYLIALDLLGYLVHRAQHQFEWWWRLHALHHSQRQMTMWSDNRNHLLDDVLRAVIFVLVARLIGVGPGQFVALTALSQLLENLQHANTRLWFGPLFERVLVSPRFHRVHHAIGIGHESHGKGTLGGHNFAVLLPVWDMLFGTANFELRYGPTGIRDQLSQEGGRDYGRGFWSQQWLGLKRLAGKA